jgi:hypothetical protein
LIIATSWLDDKRRDGTVLTHTVVSIRNEVFLKPMHGRGCLSLIIVKIRIEARQTADAKN